MIGCKSTDPSPPFFPKIFLENWYNKYTRNVVGIKLGYGSFYKHHSLPFLRAKNIPDSAPRSW